jgi:hypothetical protein
MTIGYPETKRDGIRLARRAQGSVTLWLICKTAVVRHMVGGLAARHALPKEVVEGVTERTGGVPLFVEEE